MTLAVVDLPQPDSPTMPIVPPGMSLSVRPFTACTRLGWKSEPVRDLNVTEMLSRKMMGVCPEVLSAIYLTSSRETRPFFASSSSGISDTR